MTLQHLRSSTANKRPDPTAMADGQIALNTAAASPGLFYKDSAGNLVKAGPVHVGSTAPNVSPASGGTAGNSTGESWLDTSGSNPLLKVWNGSSWQTVQPVASGTVVSTADTGSVTSTMIANGTIVDADINASAAIADTKLATISTAGKVSNSATTATSANTASAIVARDASGNFTAGTITANLTGTASAIADSSVTDAKVSATAAIAGTKISPDFGSQNVTTTGTATAASLIPSSSTVPTNGVYLPSANTVGISANSVGRLFIDSSGNVGVGQASPIRRLHLQSTGEVYQKFSNNSTGSTITDGFDIGLGSAGTAYLWNYEADSTVFATNNTERLRIASDGKVGLGTSSATDLLSVGTLGASTDATITLGSSATSSGQIYFGDGTGASRYRGYVQYNHSSDTLILGSAGSDRVTIDSSGRVGVGSTQVRDSAKFAVSSGESAETIALRPGTGTANLAEILCYNYGTTSYIPLRSIASEWRFEAAAGERARIDSSGRLLVGTSSARSNFFNTASSAPQQFQVEGTSGNACSVASICSVADTSGGRLLLAHQRSGAVGGNTILNSGDQAGYITFQGNDGGEFVECASIEAVIDGTPGANDMPGRLVFSTTADGASSPTERMRITSTGAVLVANTGFSINSTSTGFQIGSDGSLVSYASATPVAYFSRQTNDGVIIDLRQDGVQEGTISVSGTTVSYNGAHLSRWSQLPSGAERTEILRGSVLSNIDEMCEWTDEENEQLNRMKVSDVEGDKNVAGVFQGWDDDDDTYTNDFYCAMTGDFIIRIAAGVTVERGDLLMSAGDGTAKPQDDDIIRSKTIAKVTSTDVSCTYDDGSYCVPCVLMAC